MSRRNQSRRRRSYGRRQHELGERRTEHEVRWLPYEWQPGRSAFMEPGDETASEDARGMAGA
jgi:hypothetical protein